MNEIKIWKKKMNIHNSRKSYLQTIFTKILVVKGSCKFQGTFIDRLGLSQEGGGGLRISSDR